MTAMLTDNLPLIAAAPVGIKKLRELILELAVRGALVPQDTNDEPAIKLLERIQLEKERLIREGVIRPRSTGGVSADVQALMLPATWIWTTLADVALINPRNNANDESEASFVPMTYIGTRFEGTHQQDVRAWKDIKQGFTHFAEGDIAVAKITPCFENSKACVFSSLRNGIGAGTTELHVVRPISGLLAPRYVLAYLKSPRFLAIGESGMSGTAGQKRLPKEFVESNPFPLPPLAEQHRIVTKADELMALCDRLESGQADSERAHQQLVTELLATLTQSATPDDFAANWQRLSQHFDTLFTTEASIDALKQTILQLAVMGKLVPQDMNAEPADDLLVRISGERAKLISEGAIRTQKVLEDVSDEGLPFSVPKSWAWGRLGSLVLESGAGWSPSCDSCPREGSRWGVLKVSAVSWGAYQPEANKALPDYLDARPEHEVVAGDFLVSRANTAELVARSVVVDATPSRLMLSDKIVRLKLTGLCNRHYVNLANSADYARSYYGRVAGGTSSSMKNVSREQILGLLVPIPPLEEQDRIVARMAHLATLCDSLRGRITDACFIQECVAKGLVEGAASR